MRAAAHALAVLGVLVAPGAAFASQESCAAVAGPQGSADPRLREWLRRLIHEVARKEGVDPAALEALAVTETDIRPSIGKACELGPFQVSQQWARIFQLPSAELLWDPRINAIAAGSRGTPMPARTVRSARPDSTGRRSIARPSAPSLTTGGALPLPSRSR